MKISIVSFVFLLASATAANSYESIEALRVGTQASFGQLMRVKLKPQKATRFVNVAGYLSLNGSSFVNDPNGGSVMVTFHGSTTVTDPGGVTGNASFSTTQTFFINGNFTSGYVHPNAYVQLYKNGRPVGSVNVSGSVYVSGFVNGNWVNLSGSGQVSGSGSVQD